MAYTQRQVSWAIQKAYLHSNRKATAPATTSSKYSALLALADSMQKLWEDEPGEEWSSRYSLVTLTPVVTATDTFALHDSINFLSKKQGEYVQVTDGTQTKTYKIISPNQLYEYRERDAVAQIGRTLKFSKAFTSVSAELGYNIKVPAITYCDDIDAASDYIQVDEPMWLAYMMAAEFVRNDVTKRGEYNAILALADQVMQKMKQANSGGAEVVPSGIFATGETWS